MGCLPQEGPCAQPTDEELVTERAKTRVRPRFFLMPMAIVVAISEILVILVSFFGTGGWLPIVAGPLAVITTTGLVVLAVSMPVARFCSGGLFRYLSRGKLLKMADDRELQIYRAVKKSRRRARGQVGAH